MAELDFNQVYDGVTLALHLSFPNARIHGGTVKQDLQDGDFNVLPIAANHMEQMGNRAQRNSVFDVIYYPSVVGGRTECLQIAHQLTEVLRIIETPNGDKIHCLSFDTTIEDDALHCLVSYPHFVYAPEHTDLLEKLQIE